jgi:hypothetical protein
MNGLGRFHREVAAWLQTQEFTPDAGGGDRLRRFGRRTSESWQLIEIQTIRTGGSARVSVDYGVALLGVMAFYEEQNSAPRAVASCHWGRRLRQECADVESHWIVLDDDSDPSAAAASLIRELETVALPGMNGVTQAQLQHDWLQGLCTGISDSRRLELLSVLLKSTRQTDRLAHVLDELKRRATAPRWRAIAAHLRLLERWQTDDASG